MPGSPAAADRLGRDFEDLAAVDRICARIVADGLDPGRLHGLVHIGVDEVSYKRHHHYLTLVYDHARQKIVWGRQGKDTTTLDKFFAELGQQRAHQLEATSMDMGPTFANSTTTHAPTATRCIDSFHSVKIVTDALDQIRRSAWQQMRRTDPAAAHRFKGARLCLGDHLHF